MTSLVANLIPLTSGGAEVLRSGLTARPTMKVEQSHALQTNVMLGRNASTCISDPRISRRIAKIKWQLQNNNSTTTSSSSWELIMELQSGKGNIQVNDVPVTAETPLYHNDTIAVIASDLSVSYSYRVEILQGSNNSATTNVNNNQGAAQPSSEPFAVRAGPQPSVAQSSGAKRPSPVTPTVDCSQEFLCAVCLDILVEAMTAVPCGHSFCRSCVTGGLRDCPTCRTRLTGAPFPSRQLDKAIELLVDGQPHLFEGDDVTQYYTRTNRAKPSVGTHNPVPTKKFKGQSADNAIVID